jgi:hypothetical protein
MSVDEIPGRSVPAADYAAASLVDIVVKAVFMWPPRAVALPTQEIAMRSTTSAYSTSVAAD